MTLEVLFLLQTKLKRVSLDVLQRTTSQASSQQS